jgi:predicted RNA-binding protein associated with RNAse of E/G family
VERPLRRFDPGSVVVRRHIWFGRVANSKALTVIEDSEDIVAMSLVPGTVFKIATPRTDRMGHLQRLASRTWELLDDQWRETRVLILARPGDAYSIWAFWTHSTNEFRAWYVNFEDPLRRSPMGFDTRDLFLDIVVPSGERWHWKDEDELEEAVRIDLITPDEAAAVRATAAHVIDLIEGGDAWWTAWRDRPPDPSTPVPVFPDGWDVV